MQRDNENTTRVEQTINDIREDWTTHKKLFIQALIAITLCSIVGTSLIVQLYFVLVGTYPKIYPGELFTAWLTNWITIILTVVVLYAFCSGAYKFRMLFSKNYVMNYEENYKQAKSGVYGDAHWMTKEEKKEVFNISKNIEDLSGDIIGYDDNNNIYSLKEDLVSINRNKLIFGASRSGKSASIIINDVLQSFRRGESVILTDTKGDLYRELYAKAKEYGYIVRALNFKATELMHSDGWEPMKYVTKENTIQAEVLANAIILNTLDGARKDFWAVNEMNCLKAAILLVATSEEYEGRRSFKEVINIISDQQGFDSKFAGLHPSNVAKLAFDKYCVAKDDVKKQILNGMTIRLALMDDPYVKQIIGNDEVDLLLPMKKKCIYFIIVSDTDTSMKFLSSMFFTQIFMAQCDYSDGLSKKQKLRQLFVRYELDEFKNIGEIPFFDVKISTFASRKITSTLCLQTYAQLKQMYPDGGDAVIIANSSIKLLLKAGDMETAELFQDLCGTATVIVNNGRYSKDRSQILDIHNEETVSDGYGKRDILMADKAMKLHRDILVCCISGYQPVKLKKYIAEIFNPYFQDIEETPPNRRRPKWRKQQELAAKALEERFNAPKPDPVAKTESKISVEPTNTVPVEIRKSVPVEVKKDTPTTPPGDNKSKWVCSECGVIYEQLQKFCSECGGKIQSIDSSTVTPAPVKEKPQPPPEKPPEIKYSPVKRNEHYTGNESKANRIIENNKKKDVKMVFEEEIEESKGDDMLFSML